MEFLHSFCQTSFGGETNGSVAKCRLFSHAMHCIVVVFLPIIERGFGSHYNDSLLLINRVKSCNKVLFFRLHWKVMERS